MALEDELGDVLDKAIVFGGWTVEATAVKADVEVTRLRDALDWRSELTEAELTRLARALGLNEVGLCALAQGRYPLPRVEGLPFCLFPLRMPHGIGVVNAYVVAECGSDHGVLFDTGPSWNQLRAVWPASIRRLDAVFLTHREAEHSGGLAGLVAEMPVGEVYAGVEEVPATVPCRPVLDQQAWAGGWFEVKPFSTPGHAASHFGYQVTAPRARQGRGVFISGDLLFAATVGGAFYCRQRLRQSLHRVIESLPADTIIAPGHGPLTTLANEKRYNPFIV